MTGVLASVILAGLGILLFAVERSRAPGGPTDRRARGWAFAWLAALVVVVPFVAWLLFEITAGLEPGPARPPDPFRHDTGFDLDLDLFPVVVAAGAALLAGLASVVALVYGIGARRGAAQRQLGVPTGTTTLKVMRWLAIVTTLLALGRAPFGAVADELGWYGSVTVPGDDGVRAHATVRNISAGPRRDVIVGAPVEDDRTRWSGSDCCGGFASPGGSRTADGLHAWVGGEPVLFVRDDHGVTMHRVGEREPGTFEDRARFVAIPQCVEVKPPPHGTGSGRVLLVDETDGLRTAMLDPYGPTAPSRAELGLVARPPLGPWTVLAGLWLLAVALGRKAEAARRPGPRRLAAALCLAFVCAVVVGSFGPTFGVP